MLHSSNMGYKLHSLELKDASPDASSELLAPQAVSISSDLYGNDTMLAF